MNGPYPQVPVLGETPNRGLVDQALRNLRLGTYGSAGEILDVPIYDSQSLLTTITEYLFFTSGVNKPFDNAAAGVKNRSHTNIDGNTIVPTGQKFTAYALEVEIHSPGTAVATATMPSILNFLRGAILTLIIDGKAPIFEDSLASILGLSFNMQLTPTAVGDNIFVPVRDNVKRRSLKIPVIIAENVQFRAALRCNTASVAAMDGYFVTVKLQGYKERLA